MVFFCSKSRPITRTLTWLVALAAAWPAWAQSGNSPKPAENQGGDNAPSQPAWAGDLDTRSNLLGDIGGLRAALDRSGVAFGLTETTESLGNPIGGIKPGSIVEGLAQMSLGADLSKSLGIDGALFNISAYQIHGRGLTSGNVASLNILSSIEADASTRLNELWIQQSFWDGKVDVKVGQQSADFEFITSEYMDLFVNSGFGWPTLPAADLPAGGPAYPLPTPGLRLRARPTDAVTTLIGLFDGSPAGLRPGDPQRLDDSGTNFNLSDGVFAMGEIQYAVNADKNANGLRGTYKLGGWYNSNRFADAFYEQGATFQLPGILFGIPKSHHGDWSLYGTIDQLVYQPDKDAGGLAVTARAMGAPGDRNLIDLFLQGGLVYKGPFGRTNDSVGLGAEWARVSQRVREGELAAVVPTAFSPIQSSETVIEATYQAQVKPWWQLQPDLQVVVHPGAGVVDPDNSTRRIGTALVLGLRSIVTF